MTDKPNTGALAGIRVLDLGSAVAAPFCAQLLADQGADVIKIEPLTGDVLRMIPPFARSEDGSRQGSSYHTVNRNKRSLAIDLTTEAGRDLLLDMVEHCDAVVENFRAGVMERLGLSYETLSARNPRLVYTAIRGFGDPRSGETAYTSWPCVDVVAQAFSGLMAATGPDARSPTLVGGVLGDTVPGLFGAFATLTALWHARATGQGQFVDVAMTDTMLAMSGANIVAYAASGQPQPASGNRLPTVSPFGELKAADGAIMLAAPPGRFWTEVCSLIGQPELAQDPRFDSPAKRIENEAEVYATLEAFTRSRTKAELVRLFGGKVPVAPIYYGDEVCEDPYFTDREMLPEIDQPGTGPIRVLGVPAKLHKSPGGVRHRAPALGEHSVAVMREIGITPDRIARLRDDGVVGGVPADAETAGS